eukprot:11119556-Alexandrium_andersonii.AAC.1
MASFPQRALVSERALRQALWLRHRRNHRRSPSVGSWAQGGALGALKGRGPCPALPKAGLGLGQDLKSRLESHWRAHPG